MTDTPAENVAYFTADKWGGYWQTVRDGRPYNFRLDLSHRKYVESLEERMARLEEALRKAILWTDEENDVGPWREEAARALSQEGSDA